jgi:hypothetical protein
MTKRSATPVRFDSAVAERLTSFAAANPGMSLSSAANRLKSARAAEPDLAEDDMLAVVADNTDIAVRLLRVAIRYWASYPGEIGAEIAAAHAAEDAAEQAWGRERDLLVG